MTIRDADLGRVRDLRVFSVMEADTFRALTAPAMLQKYPPGTGLVMEGDPVDCLYILLDGSVEIQGTWNGKETTVSVLRPVSLFILSSVVLDAPALACARTLDCAEVMRLPADMVRHAMRRDGAFALAMAQELAGWNQAMVRQIKDMKLRTSAEQLANYLLTLQVRQGGSVVQLPHEKRTLAALLGMSPENLSRAFITLADHGVCVKGNIIQLNSDAALRRLAKPSPLIDNHLPAPSKACGEAEREGWPQNTANARFIFD